MKYLLILFISMFVIFTSCKKKKTPEHCYTCMGYDSTHSNIVALTSVLGSFNTALDTMCNYTDQTISYYMQTHKNIPDTQYNKHDTLIVQYSSIICSDN